MEYVLKTKELTKIYSKTAVVDSVSIEIRPGEIYGFVGKNGAGKTTFIRTILGLTTASEGSFSFFDGEDIKSAGKRIGSLIESPALYKNMNARANLELYCTMLGADKKCVDEILEIVKLKNTGKKKAKDFSLGMKQRLGIGMALVGDPEFLILDEPINGLDPMGIVEIRELILEMKNRGKTVFISSHFLGELEKIATRYGIISSGRIVEEITSERLAEICSERTAIKTDNPEKAREIICRFLKTDNAVIENGIVMIKENIGDIGRVTNELFKSGITVKSILNDNNSAEEYFIKKMEEG